MAAARRTAPAGPETTVRIPTQVICNHSPTYDIIDACKSQYRHPDHSHGPPREALASRPERNPRQEAYIEYMSRYLQSLDEACHRSEHEKQDLKNQCTALKANEEFFATEREAHMWLFRQHEEELNIHRFLTDILLMKDPSVAINIASDQLIERNACLEITLDDLKHDNAQLVERTKASESRVQELGAEIERVLRDNTYLQRILWEIRDPPPSAILQKEIVGSVRSDGSSSNVVQGLGETQKGSQ